MAILCGFNLFILAFFVPFNRVRGNYVFDSLTAGSLVSKTK